MTSNVGLSLQYFLAGKKGFFRAPVLLSGKTESVLIDGGFTLSDGKALADAIHANGKALKAVYISQSDPDYYFSLAPIRAAYPDVPVTAASATLAAIEASVQKKLDAWLPQLKDNGPQKLTDVVLPAASDIRTLDVDGEVVEIIDANGMPNRRYLWIPSLGAIVGGVLVFSGVHVWTADTATTALRAAWIKNLEEMAARSPRIVVPGHCAIGSATDLRAIIYTRDYLLAFEQELTRAANSVELVMAMKQRYPEAEMEVALNIGAKVALGEMKWG